MPESWNPPTPVVADVDILDADKYRDDVYYNLLHLYDGRPRAQISVNGGTVMTAGVPYLVPYDSIDFEHGYDAAVLGNSRIRVLSSGVAGLGLCYASFSPNVNPAFPSYVALRVNGTTEIARQGWRPTGFSCMVWGVHDFAVSDYIETMVLMTTSSGYTIPALRALFMGVVRL